MISEGLALLNRLDLTSYNANFHNKGTSMKENTSEQESTAAKASNPEQELREKRLSSHASPFRGVSGKAYYFRQFFYLIFFLPGFFAARQAKKIVATGNGKVWGYNDLIYAYPIIPITAIFVTISMFFDPSALTLQIMGVIWTVSFLMIIATIGEDISGRMVGALIGTMLALGVAWIVLESTGSVEVSGGIWKFLKAFNPEFAPGIPLLISVGILILLIYSAIRSNLSQVLYINGNRWSPSKLNTEATFDSENHRCYARTPDWLERAIFGCRDIHIIPILEARNTKSTELGEAAVFSLENVPAGGLIYSAIEATAAATEVERIG